MAGKYGAKASTRFGLGILRSNAVTKITNINTPVAPIEAAESSRENYSKTNFKKSNLPKCFWSLE